MRLGAGDILFRQGERGDLIYLVESGQIEVYRELANGDTEVLRRMGAGHYVGELGPILNLPRSASVRALEDVVLTGYTARAFRKVIPTTFSSRRLLRGMVESCDSSLPPAPPMTVAGTPSIVPGGSRVSRCAWA